LALPFLFDFHDTEYDNLLVDVLLHNSILDSW